MCAAPHELHPVLIANPIICGKELGINYTKKQQFETLAVFLKNTEAENSRNEANETLGFLINGFLVTDLGCTGAWAAYRDSEPLVTAT